MVYTGRQDHNIIDFVTHLIGNGGGCDVTNRRRWLTRIATAIALGLACLGSSQIAHAENGIPWMYDVDGDGQYDPYLYDTLGSQGMTPDGYVDQNWVLFSELKRMGWLIDVNQNTLPDQVQIDFNNDSKADAYFWLNETDGTVLSYWLDPAVFPNVNLLTGQPGGVSFQIWQDPLGTSPNDIMDTVNSQGGIVTDPCAPLTWTLGDNLICRTS